MSRDITSQLNGTCAVCGNRITTEEGGIEIDYDNYHFHCVDKHIERIKERRSYYKDLNERWENDVKYRLEDATEHLGAEIKGHKQLSEALNQIYDELFPNHLISSKTVISPSLDYGEKLGITEDDREHYNSTKGHAVIISSRGVGTQNEYKDMASYDTGPHRLLIMMAYKMEILNELSSHNDRQKKFKQFVSAMEEVVDVVKLYNYSVRFGAEKYPLYDDELRNHHDEVDKHEVNYTDERLTGLASYKMYGSLSVVGMRGSKKVTGSLSFNKDLEKIEVIETLLPVIRKVVNEGYDKVKAQNKKIGEKIAQVKSRLKTYLLAYSL